MMTHAQLGGELNLLVCTSAHGTGTMWLEREALDLLDCLLDQEVGFLGQCIVACPMAEDKSPQRSDGVGTLARVWDEARLDFMHMNRHPGRLKSACE